MSDKPPSKEDIAIAKFVEQPTAHLRHGYLWGFTVLAGIVTVGLFWALTITVNGQRHQIDVLHEYIRKRAIIFKSMAEDIHDEVDRQGVILDDRTDLVHTMMRRMEADLLKEGYTPEDIERIDHGTEPIRDATHGP